MKQKTIRFSYQFEPLVEGHNYYCTQVTESLDYIPGERYTAKQVQELINSKYWKVTIVAGNKD